MNAEERARSVMNQLREEIPEFNLDRRFLAIMDGSHQTQISYAAFIADRYTIAIQEVQRETIEECVSIVDQFLGPGITILHVPRARANLIARLRALKESR